MGDGEVTMESVSDLRWQLIAVEISNVAAGVSVEAADGVRL